MNNLPYELGKAIFKEMDNAPKTDRDVLNKRAELLEKKIIEDRMYIHVSGTIKNHAI